MCDLVLCLFLAGPMQASRRCLNALIGEKIAIVSNKPQTTRNRIQGIVEVPARKGKNAAQIIFRGHPGGPPARARSWTGA